MKDWQRGRPLEELKRLSAPFLNYHKPHVYGAFGLIKERDVAAALAESRLIWIAEKGQPAKSAMIFNVLKSPSLHLDFAGRKVPIPRSTLYISALAGDRSSCTRMLEYAERQSAGRAAGVYVEIFEEEPEAKAAVIGLGYEYLTTKIMAGSEVKGLYFKSQARPELGPPFPADMATLAILRREWLSEADHEAIRAEAAKAADLWAQHYSSYNKRQSWTAIAIRGFFDDPARIEKPAEMSRQWKAEHEDELANKPRWTPAAEAFPRCRIIAESLGCQLDRVRLMRLAAKDGELSRHADITDREAGALPGSIARFHIPIETNEWVEFSAWDARGRTIRRNFPERSLCYLDQRKPHTVSNGGDADRIHLVIDVICNAEISKMIADHA